MFSGVLVLIVLACLLFLKFKSKHRHPPGPMGIPLFGYLPSFLGPKPYELLDHWAKIYGPLFTLKIGGRRYYVLNSVEVIRAAYIQDGNGNNFLDRPTDFNILGSFLEFRALAFKNGPEWAFQRKLMTSLMKKNHTSLEASIAQSGKELVRRIHELPIGEPVDLFQILAEEVLNVISTLICNQRLAETLPEVAAQIIRDTHLVFANTPGGDGFLCGFLVKILANRFTQKAKVIKEIRNREFQLMKQFVTEHEANFNPSVIKDYIDNCLFERSKSDPEPGRQTWLGRSNLLANMFMFFIAGVDTSSITFYYAIFLLAKYPQVQEKCFQELTCVVGQGSGVTVTMRDKSRLPYLSAVVNEVNRYSVVGPLPQPRQNLGATQLAGYDIPAGSHFITNLWTASRDSKHFANPHEFDPDNFYGKQMHRDLMSLNFSAGKRGCPAENLAIMELFLFLAILIQNFQILAPSGEPLQENIIPGFGRLLAPFKLIFNKRQ